MNLETAFSSSSRVHCTSACTHSPDPDKIRFGRGCLVQLVPEKKFPEKVCLTPGELRGGGSADSLCQGIKTFARIRPREQLADNLLSPHAFSNLLVMQHKTHEFDFYIQKTVRNQIQNSDVAF